MNILYIENQVRFAEMVIKAFLSDHAVHVVASVAAARTALASGAVFDSVLLDYDLDDGGKGVKPLGELRARTPRPVIVAASSHDAANAALMANGADVVCRKRDFANINAVLAAALASVTE